MLRSSTCEIICNSDIYYISSGIKRLVYAFIVNQHTKFTDLVYMLPMNFDIVDGSWLIE